MNETDSSTGASHGAPLDLDAIKGRLLGAGIIYRHDAEALLAELARLQSTLKEVTESSERYAMEAYDLTGRLMKAESTLAQQQEHVATVLRGFDEGVFVRNTANDGAPDWGMKLLPFIAALAALAALHPKDGQ